MRKYILFFTALVSFFLFSNCATNSDGNHPRGSEISITWELLSVQPESQHKSRVAFTFVNNGRRPLGNSGWVIYFNQISEHVIPESLPAEIRIENITGEYYKLYPTRDFQPLKPGQCKTFEYGLSNIVLRKSDAPVGLYIVFGDSGEPQLITDYLVKPISREVLKGLNTPTPESRFEEDRNLTMLPNDQVPKILPRPYRVIPKARILSFTGSITIRYQTELENEANFLAEFLKSVYLNEIRIQKGNEPGPNVIQLMTANVSVNNTTAEAYILAINDQGVQIRGSDPAGVFYGIQSLIALLPIDVFRETQPALELHFVTIEDAPRFPYRGLHLDVSRNFHSKESVKKLFDLMSFYKLNKFHFHLADDEGWRLAIDGLPELTEVGARRGHTTTEEDKLYPAYGSGPFSDPEKSWGTGHYSREDFIEILRYATARHIEVIPEIDVPGHARAAIKAMDARYRKFQALGNLQKAQEYLLRDFEDQSEYTSAQDYHDNVICVGLESTYNFIEAVIESIISMYREADALLATIHSGGDEVPEGSWEKSSVCKQFLDDHPEIEGVENLHAYFLKRFNKILMSHNLITAGWEEIVLKKVIRGDEEKLEPNPEFLDNKFRAYVWNAVWGWGGEDLAYRLANFGYSVVMCNASNLYFDLAYDRDPDETGLNWSGYVDTRKPFELVPLDIFKTADKDMHGNLLNVEELMRGKVRLSGAGRQNFLGIQGQVWSETIRGPEKLEYMIFPKLLGLAERGWAADPAWVDIQNRDARFTVLEKDWNIFVNMLGQRELPRLDYLFDGVKYRIPLPGATIENSKLKANVRFPGLIILYSLDGSDPDLNSKEYSGPVKVSGQIKLKTFSLNGRSSRTSIVSE